MLTNFKNNSSRFASFGAIHLNNTSLKKSIYFWTKIVGMNLKSFSSKMAEFGTINKTLVVVHESATKPFQKGYSGLYHVAIHAPNKEEFASMINRLIFHNYAFSPVDHTMSKSVYLDDPDGINIEFTLETPERFKKVVTTNGLKIEDTHGNIKSASDYLDVQKILDHLKDKSSTKIIDDNTYIGHLHLYAKNVEDSNRFYKKLGFTTFNNLPQFMYSDLGYGGAYQHRIALNSWHGINKPLAPKEYAGLKYFQIQYNTKNKLDSALQNISKYDQKDDGYYVKDTSGNDILLTCIKK